MAEPSTVNEADQLGTQLPELVRGIYYDRIAADADLAGETSASYAVRAAATVLRRHVSSGELDDIRAQLPEGIQPISG